MQVRTCKTRTTKPLWGPYTGVNIELVCHPLPRLGGDMMEVDIL
jgi:alpha/beta superfamily hydrolase